MLDPVLPLLYGIPVFLFSAALIGYAGTKLTAMADALAERTGIGEATFGVALLGGATSLGGVVTALTAAVNEHESLAIGTAIGGIASQTTYLAIADITYRKANLEHASASVANLTNGVLLLTLISVPLIAVAVPGYSLWAIHPATPVLVGLYVMGLRLVSKAESRPMWHPRETAQTEKPNRDGRDETGMSLTRMWVWFFGLAVIVAGAGWSLTQGAVSISTRTGLSEVAVGGLFTAIATSLPELVTCLAAVRRGALALAVGDILGGNAFDILTLVVVDVAYRPGPIYGAWTSEHTFTLASTALMVCVLMLGFLHREKYGFARIGFESTLILAIYGVVASYLFTR